MNNIVSDFFEVGKEPTLAQVSSLTICLERADAADLLFNNGEFANYMSRNYNSVETFNIDWDNYINTDEFLELEDEDKKFLETIFVRRIKMSLSQRPQQSQDPRASENQNRRQPIQGLLRGMFRCRPARDDTGSTRNREGDGDEGPHPR